MCWCDNKYRFYCIRNIWKRKQASGKKHAEHCLTHPNKTACEIWSGFDKVHFCVKYLTPFIHQTLKCCIVWEYTKPNYQKIAECLFKKKTQTLSHPKKIFFCTTVLHFTNLWFRFDSCSSHVCFTNGFNLLYALKAWLWQKLKMKTIDYFSK